MNTMGIVILIIVVSIIVAVFKSKSKTPEDESKETWPFFPKPLMSRPEQVLYFRLVKALPEQIVLAQVQLSRILGVKKGHSFKYWYNRINRMSADFAVCNKDSRVVAVIELDDSSHEREDRKIADAKKDKALTSAGIRTVRWQASALPDEETIKSVLAPNTCEASMSIKRLEPTSSTVRAPSQAPDVYMGWREIGSSVASVVLLGLVAYWAYDRWIAYPTYPEPLDPAQRYTCTVREVVDGDTLECREGRSRVRLLEIDAPEFEQAGLGTEATTFLTSLTPADSVVQLELDRETHDQYGRILAYAWLPDGRLVNEEMVRAGYAITLFYQPNDKYLVRVRESQRLSKAANAGLWAVDGFRCPPVAFRHGRCS